MSDASIVHDLVLRVPTVRRSESMYQAHVAKPPDIYVKLVFALAGW
jgi:hypothetical protein